MRESINRSISELPTTALQQLLYLASEQPDRTAIEDSYSKLSFRELIARATALAKALQTSGAVRGSVIAVATRSCLELVVAAVAAWIAEAAYLPVDPEGPQQRLSKMLSAANCSLLITSQRYADMFTKEKCKTLLLESVDLFQARQEVSIPPLAVSEDDLERVAYVIFTSGSTGEPKGVAVAHRNLSSLIAWHREAFHTSERDRGAQFASLTFDAAVLETWPLLCNGASLHAADSGIASDASQLLRFLVEKEISVAFAVSPVAEQLIQLSWPRETRLRYLLTGADVLRMRPPEELPFELVNNYGPTECTVLATSGRVAPPSEAEGPPTIGQPIAGAEVYILDESLRPVDDGAPGQIAIGGVGVSAGYVGRPGLTRERFISNPYLGDARIYLTGDRGRRLPNGEIEFLGRLDDQIKWRGYRIEPGEIVAALVSHPLIDRAEVMLAGTEPDRQLTAYVAGSEHLRACEVQRYLSSLLPGYMVPEAIVRLERLPLLPNGKLDRAALRDRDSSADLRASSSPTDVIQQQVLDIAQKLLKREHIDPNENLFRIGGHSLFAAQLVTRLRAAFGIDLSLRAVFESPSVLKLAETVEAHLMEALERNSELELETQTGL